MTPGLAPESTAILLSHAHKVSGVTLIVCGSRLYCGLTGGVFVFAGQHQTYSALTHFGGVSRSFVHRLILSRKLASDQPGAVQRLVHGQHLAL